MARKLDRRTFIGAAAGAAGATALGPWGPVSLGQRQGQAQGQADRSARPARRPAVLDPRLDHAARRVGDRVPRAARTSRRTRRTSGPLMRAAGRLRRGVRVPRLRRLRRLRVLLVQPGSERRDHQRGDPHGARQRRPAGRRHPHRRAPGDDRCPPTARPRSTSPGSSATAWSAPPATRRTRRSGTLAAWQRYAEQANTVGAAFRAAGIKYFFHPEQDWFRFFDDPAHPELDRVHRIDWFTDNTDPKLVFFEPDTMHTLAGRGRFPDPVDGRLFDVNAWYGRLARGRPADRLAHQGRRPRHPAAGTRAPTRSRRRACGRASRSTTASTSSTSARARSPAATQSTPTPR